MAWIDDLARRLGEEPLSPEQVERLLGVARDVAHGVERRVTPLSAFLAGLAVARRDGGEGRDAALAAVLDDLRAAVAAAATGDDAGGSGEEPR